MTMCHVRHISSNGDFPSPELFEDTDHYVASMFWSLLIWASKYDRVE
jgi:hypothetical protein